MISLKRTMGPALGPASGRAAGVAASGIASTGPPSFDGDGVIGPILKCGSNGVSSGSGAVFVSALAAGCGFTAAPGFGVPAGCDGTAGSALAALGTSLGTSTAGGTIPSRDQMVRTGGTLCGFSNALWFDLLSPSVGGSAGGTSCCAVIADCGPASPVHGKSSGPASICGCGPPRPEGRTNSASVRRLAGCGAGTALIGDWAWAAVQYPERNCSATVSMERA